MSALIVGMGVLSAPLALDNGHIRIEFDPYLFCVTFVGVPTGENFISAVHSAAAESGEANVGQEGLATDVIPFEAEEVALRRGPSEILEARADYVAAQSSVSERRGLRIRKEVRLVDAEARARYRVIVENVGGSPVSVAVRNTVRLPARCTVQVDRAHGLIRPLAGAQAAAPAVVKSRKTWLIPVPPTARMDKVVLGGTAPAFGVATRWGAWTRRIISPVGPTDGAADPTSFLCLLDDSTGSYAAALQGPTAQVSVESSLVFEEEWILAKRGR